MFDVENAVGDLPEQIVSYIKTITGTANRIIEYRHQTIPPPTMTKSRASAEKEVRSWGFGHVFTWTDGP